MKNPMIDALKRLKAKRVAVVIGDADELGLSDMVQMPDAGDGGAIDEEAGEELMDDERLDAKPAPGDDDDTGEQDFGQDDQASPMDEAKRVMGRRPFEKRSAQDDSEDLSEDVAEDLYDEKIVERVQRSGRRPKNLMERAQMKLAERFRK